jgi:hypothetical protein
MRRLTTRITSALVLASSLGLLPTAQADAAPRRPVLKVQTDAAPTQDALDVVNEVNRWRTSAGFVPLQLTTRADLTASVRRSIEHNTTRLTLEHPKDWAEPGCTPYSEVLAATTYVPVEMGGDGYQETGAQAAQQWKRSQPHYEALMGKEARLISFDMTKTKYTFEGGFVSDMAWFGAQLMTSCDSSPAPTTTTPPQVTPKSPLRVERRARVVRH